MQFGERKKKEMKKSFNFRFAKCFSRISAYAGCFECRCFRIIYRNDDGREPKIVETFLDDVFVLWGVLEEKGKNFFHRSFLLISEPRSKATVSRFSSVLIKGGIFKGLYINYVKLILVILDPFPWSYN